MFFFFIIFLNIIINVRKRDDRLEGPHNVSLPFFWNIFMFNMNNIVCFQIFCVIKVCLLLFSLCCYLFLLEFLHKEITYYGHNEKWSRHLVFA